MVILVLSAPNTSLYLLLDNNICHNLELYADDCKIFLEPEELNLRNAMKTLGLFYKLSGLNISLSKTKAIWFGRGFNDERRLKT